MNLKVDILTKENEEIREKLTSTEEEMLILKSTLEDKAKKIEDLENKLEEAILEIDKVKSRDCEDAA